MAEIQIVKGKAEHAGDTCIGSKWNVDMTIGCACRYLGGECTYPCYGHHINYGRQGGPEDTKTLKIEKLRKFMRENKMQTLRFGKFTDPGAEWTMSNLKALVMLCEEEGVRPIIVTKLLKYDKELSKALVKARGTIHYSLGNDEMEPGACKVNTNQQRMEECLKYRKDGVNAIVRIVLDATKAPEEDSMYGAAHACGIPALITPVRCKSGAELESWRANKENYTFFKGFYRPNSIHKAYKGEMVCGETSDGAVHCGKCGLKCYAKE